MSEAWYPVLSVPADADLRIVSAVLWRQKIAHRVVSNDDAQIVFASRNDQEDILRVFSVWEQGQLEHLESESLASVVAPSQWYRVFLQPPITMFLILLSALGFLLGGDLLPLEWRFQFTFQGFGKLGNYYFTDHELLPWQSGEWWRLVTPIFLHFSLMHVVFNSLWLWEFGRRIEQVISGRYLLVLVLVIGVLSNFAQFLSVPNNPFGGMSGVNYGLLGYLWLRCRLVPHPELQLPSGIVVVLLVFLALGFTGMLDALAGGGIANASHLGGFIVGALWGLLDGYRARTRTV